VRIGKEFCRKIFNVMRRRTTFKKMNWLRKSGNYLCIFLLIALIACSGSSQDSTYLLTLVHVNDTHSHLEPLAVNLQINGVKTTAPLGVFARLKTALDEMRALYPHMLLLHGGDAVQGTLYFTLFGGNVEFDFLNLLGVDAMTFGNHEFDRGCRLIPGWITRSNFPWLSANIDFTGEPAILNLVAPYLIKVIQGERVAVIGVTTETTPQSTLDVGHAVFLSAVESTRLQVNALTAMGINKIVVVSHLGYRQDLALAAQVSGVDIVVGGHSHSLLGDEKKLLQIGLAPEGNYPTELWAPDGKRVLVLQAWQWGHLLGRLQVRFTPAGEIVSHNSKITIPLGDSFVQGGAPVDPLSQTYRDILAALAASGSAQIYPEDPQVAALLAPYARQVAQYRSVKVATAINPIVCGLNSGPGPLACDSMLAAVPNARAALINYGGVRRDLEQGDITVGDVLEVMPFANTLALVDLTGLELKTALEGGIDYLITHYPGYDPPPMPYVAGMRFSVRLQEAAGARVFNLEIRDEGGVYQPVQEATVYRVVTNVFVAGGGDGFTAIKNATGFRSDTGIIDSDALREHLQKLVTVANPTEQRITIAP
jgi:5'-nucleotidase/UDP-sugar diphosphatase